MTHQSPRGRRFHLSALMMFFFLAATAAAQQDAVTSRVGPPAGASRSGAALEKETSKVSALLRCPVCQGLSISDSPAPMAVNMRQQVRDLLSRGYSEEQVLEYFEKSYGEFVRLEPKREGVNMLVWILPILALLAGGFFVFRAAKKKSGAAAPPPDVPRGDEALEPYLSRVRAIVSGEEKVADARD